LVARHSELALAYGLGLLTFSTIVGAYVAWRLAVVDTNNSCAFGSAIAAGLGPLIATPAWVSDVRSRGGFVCPAEYSMMLSGYCKRASTTAAGYHVVIGTPARDSTTDLADVLEYGNGIAFAVIVLVASVRLYGSFKRRPAAVVIPTSSYTLLEKPEV
jgi:hypothetical protein